MSLSRNICMDFNTCVCTFCLEETVSLSCHPQHWFMFLETDRQIQFTFAYFTFTHRKQLFSVQKPWYGANQLFECLNASHLQNGKLLFGMQLQDRSTPRTLREEKGVSSVTPQIMDLHTLSWTYLKTTEYHKIKDVQRKDMLWDYWLQIWDEHLMKLNKRFTFTGFFCSCRRTTTAWCSWKKVCILAIVCYEQENDAISFDRSGFIASKQIIIKESNVITFNFN